MKCYCGHDCARCLVHLSPDEVRCEGGRAGDELVFRLCRGCPFRNCCHEKGINSCGECDSQCKDFTDYSERYMNKIGQKGQDT